MIRAAVVCAVCATPAVAECVAERDFVFASMGVSGYSVRDAGVLAGQEPCRLEGLVLGQGTNLTITVEAIEWSLQGVEEDGFSETVSLDVSVRDSRMIAASEDRWVAYLLAEQARRNTIDADLSIVWTPEAGVVDIETFSLDLPGANGLEMTARSSGIASTLIFGQTPEDIAVHAVSFSVENTGFLDGLLLSFIIDRVRVVPGEPRRVMDATLSEVANMIDDWPEAVFDQDSRAALQAMVLDGPAPWGRLDVSLDAPDGIGLRQIGTATALPLAEALASVFEGATIQAEYTGRAPQ